MSVLADAMGEIVYLGFDWKQQFEPRLHYLSRVARIDWPILPWLIQLQPLPQARRF